MEGDWFSVCSSELAAAGIGVADNETKEALGRSEPDIA